MHHAIIIPHRNRNRYLPACLWSIQRSAECSLIPDSWNCWVVDLGSAEPPEVPDNAHFALCRCHQRDDVFCKPLALNIGIDLALRYDHADVLTFLDGDALVGRLWMENVRKFCDEDAPTVLSYRVRYLAPNRLDEFTAADDKGALVDEWFAKYEQYMRAFEAYRTPTNNCNSGTPAFGNSQFSILADVLGDLRFNEAFVGRGSEDLWMMREIARKHGYEDKHPDKPCEYTARVVKEADYAMFHFLQDRYEEDWFPPGRDTQNFEMYRGS